MSVLGITIVNVYVLGITIVNVSIRHYYSKCITNTQPICHKEVLLYVK